jgi:hypothetical protein
MTQKRPPLGFLLSLIGCLAAVLLVVLWARFGRPPPLRADTVQSVEISLDDLEDRQCPAKASSQDQEKIAALVALLEQGQPTPDHKCGDSGRILFQLKDGRWIRVGILAGHDSRFYEYRRYWDGKYEMARVDRRSFAEAVEGLGVNGLDQGRPE